MTKKNYLVKIDYGLSVEELVKEGRYDWVNDDITAINFPSKEKGEKKVEITLVGFGKCVSSKEVLKKMKAKDYRPATLKELLSLGAQHPNLQRKDWIVALGSTWRDSDGYLMVPYLYGREGHRFLRLVRLASGWPSYWQFAAVKLDTKTLKPSKPKDTSDTLTLSEINKKLDKVINFFSIT